MQPSHFASWRKLIASVFVPVKGNDWLGLMGCGLVELGKIEQDCSRFHRMRTMRTRNWMCRLSIIAVLLLGLFAYSATAQMKAKNVLVWQMGEFDQTSRE